MYVNYNNCKEILPFISQKKLILKHHKLTTATVKKNYYIM